jgi:hypothetical protein
LDLRWSVGNVPYNINGVRRVSYSHSLSTTEYGSLIRTVRLGGRRRTPATGVRREVELTDG